MPGSLADISPCAVYEFDRYRVRHLVPLFSDGGADAGIVSAARPDPKKGFLDIPQQIALALTGQGLIWGAIGFGPESGDVMHFDLRSGGFYLNVGQTKRNAAAAIPD